MFTFTFLFSGDAPHVEGAVAAEAFLNSLSSIGGRIDIEVESGKDFLFFADTTLCSERCIAHILSSELSIPRLCEAGAKLGFLAARHLEPNSALLTVQTSPTPVQRLVLRILWTELRTAPPLSSVSILSEKVSGDWMEYTLEGDVSAYTRLGADLCSRSELSRMQFSRPLI